MGLLFGAKKRAVAYYRHSAEDKQENSVPIQRERVHKFAAENEIEIIHEEADQGKSGLSAQRQGFQMLLRNWILNPKANFNIVLVLDVSRFGRFQNQNEAAHYEYLCDTAGKRVWYVDHGPVKDVRQPMDYLQTSIQRISAADFSRQLSEKVFHGSVKVSEQGYSAGGMACFGLGRLLLDVQKRPVRLLKDGEHKQISNERVTFQPLNDQSTRTVAEIFQRFVRKRNLPKDIAIMLNTHGIPSARGGLWNNEKVIRILMNETYTGTRIYNKTWGKLHQKKRKNPRSEWIICPHAFSAIVSPETFRIAQRRLRWLLPSRRRKGTSLIRKIEKQIISELIAWLNATRGTQSSELNAFALPILFSIRNDGTRGGSWYFTISERLRGFQTVLGIGVSLESHDGIEQLFSIPTADFGRYNAIAFSEKSSRFEAYRMKKDHIEEVVRSMLESGVFPAPHPG
ncbi:MAG: recombinase family protein [Candidatus Kerfeldbacteria bacterium]|nr:recombinase family protein [Candidatus Kerfeldbacteria bacterium]